MSIECIKCGRENLRDYPVCAHCEWVHFTDRADCRCSGEACSARRAENLHLAELQFGLALILAEAAAPEIKDAADRTVLYYGAEVLKFGEPIRHMACFPDPCAHLISDDVCGELRNQNLI